MIPQEFDEPKSKLFLAFKETYTSKNVIYYT